MRKYLSILKICFEYSELRIDAQLFPNSFYGVLGVVRRSSGPLFLVLLHFMRKFFEVFWGGPWVAPPPPLFWAPRVAVAHNFDCISTPRRTKCYPRTWEKYRRQNNWTKNVPCWVPAFQKQEISSVLDPAQTFPPFSDFGSSQVRFLCWVHFPGHWTVQGPNPFQAPHLPSKREESNTLICSINVITDNLITLTGF